MNCRHCGTKLEHLFLDLGAAPPSNAYLSEADLLSAETYYPLRIFVCHHCWLVQTEEYAHAEELFKDDYAYFSSVSVGWLDHAACYVEMITQRLKLNHDSFVIEVASNDGYLLKNFVSLDIPCLGIEPTASTATAAEALNIPVRRDFFSRELAEKLVLEGKQADLIIGNNVYAHVSDINDFTAGLESVLKPDGVVTLEFPHLLRLIEDSQFDTIYHEHFSYLSLSTVDRIFSQFGLKIIDVEALPTHGGSLRVYGTKIDSKYVQSITVSDILLKEEEAGLCTLPAYRGFQIRAENIKNALLAFLLEQNIAGKKVVAYGAAAKGNTLLNFSGVKRDLITSVYDAAPSKQGKYLPGSRIPIINPKKIYEDKPDWIIILPWNISNEIITQYQEVIQWGGRFVRVIPKLSILGFSIEND